MKARILLVGALLTLAACGGADGESERRRTEEGGTAGPDRPGDPPDNGTAPDVGNGGDGAGDTAGDTAGDMAGDTVGDDTSPNGDEPRDDVPQPDDGAASERPVINRDNHVALIAQAFAVYSGRAYDTRLTTFPYLLDTASDRCDNDGSLVADGDGSVTTARFTRCRIGADTIDGNLTRSLVADGVAARGNVRSYRDVTVTFEPDGLMEVSGVHATGFETACCVPNDDFYTVDLDYRFRYPAGTLIVEDATTRFRRVDWPYSARVEGSFTMDAPAAPGRRIAVSTPEPLSRRYHVAGSAALAGRDSLERNWSFAVGSLRLRAEDGSGLLLEALGDDATRARVTLSAGEESEVLLVGWEPWRAALRWTPLAAYDFAGRSLDVGIGRIVDTLAGAAAVQVAHDVRQLGERIAESAVASETLEQGLRELGDVVTVPSGRVRHACGLEGSVLIERASFSQRQAGEERSFGFTGYGFERCRHTLEEGDYRLHGDLDLHDSNVQVSRGSRRGASYRWGALELDMPDATRVRIDGEASSQSLDSVDEASESRHGVLRHYRRHRGDGALIDSIEDARFDCVDSRFGGGAYRNYSFDVSGTLATEGRSVALVSDPVFSAKWYLDPTDARSMPFEGRLEVVADDGTTLTLSAYPSRADPRLVDYRLGGRAPGYVATRPMIEVPQLVRRSESSHLPGNC